MKQLVILLWMSSSMLAFSVVRPDYCAHKLYEKVEVETVTRFRESFPRFKKNLEEHPLRVFITNYGIHVNPSGEVVFEVTTSNLLAQELIAADLKVAGFESEVRFLERGPEEMPLTENLGDLVARGAHHLLAGQKGYLETQGGETPQIYVDTRADLKALAARLHGLPTPLRLHRLKVGVHSPSYAVVAEKAAHGGVIPTLRRTRSASDWVFLVRLPGSVEDTTDIGTMAMVGGVRSLFQRTSGVRVSNVECMRDRAVVDITAPPEAVLTLVKYPEVLQISN